MDGTLFRCSAKNATGITTSGSATLTVRARPSFSLHPLDSSVLDGQRAVFTVAVTGQPTPTLQWQFKGPGLTGFTDVTEGGAFSGSKTDTLIINPADLSLNGITLRCSANNSAGTTVSGSATLSVSARPSFSLHPTDVTAFETGVAKFSAAAIGQPTPTLQWQMKANGATAWTDVPESDVFSGTKTPELKLVNIPKTDNGVIFRCSASNSLGVTVSASATLTVNNAPVIETTSLRGTIFTVQVLTVPGAVYKLEKRAGFSGNAWTLVDTRGGNGTALGLTDPSATDSSGIYRLNVAPSN